MDSQMVLDQGVLVLGHGTKYSRIDKVKFVEESL